MDDPAAFRSIMERALATSPAHAGLRDLLCGIGHQGTLSRDAHLRLLAERCEVPVTTLQEAARELSQGADAEL